VRVGLDRDLLNRPVNWIDPAPEWISGRDTLVLEPDDFVGLDPESVKVPVELVIEAHQQMLEALELAEKWPTPLLWSWVGADHELGAYRWMASLLDQYRPGDLVVLRLPVIGDAQGAMRAAARLGCLLCDGIGDLICLDSEGDPLRSVRLGFDILQVTGLRRTRTEYVSCPSCGRTLFDLVAVTESIKQRTGHLKDVAIAVMGCIVNGPGEMADADFGYVGGAPDKVSLYVKKECVRKNVPQAEAVEALVELIKEHGRWIEE
jgi:hypothetical protein